MGGPRRLAVLEVDLAPGTTTETRMLVWIESTVTVRVLDSGRPRAGALCRIVDEEPVVPGLQRNPGKAAADGTCVFGRLRPGRYRVEVEADGSSNEKTVEVAEDDHPRIDVSLPR